MNIQLPSFIFKVPRFLFLFCLLYAVNSNAQVTANTNPSNAQINLALQGPGIVITGGTLVGAQTDEAILRSNQVATFTNGITGAGLGFPSGAFFSTGNAAFDLANRNTEIQRSDYPAAATLSDPDLSTIDGTAINDLVAYTFTITLGPTINWFKNRVPFWVRRISGLCRYKF